MRDVFHRMRGFPIAVVLLSLVVVTEIVALYLVFPLSASTSAVHPDSLQYICYGFQIRGFDEQTIVGATIPLLAHFGEGATTCMQYGLAEPLVWQVYPRLLLPLSIAATTFVFGPWGAIVPSITFFLMAAFAWLTITYRYPLSGGPLRVNATYVLVAVGPFAAFSAMLWPAAILTEGPALLLMLLLVLSIYPHPLTLRRTSLALGIGFVLLVTRPSWPIVGVIWAAVLISFLIPRLTSSRWSLALATAITTISLATAFGLARLLEILTVPIGAREARDDLTGVTPADGFLELALESLRSTSSDITFAVSRFDLASPLLLFASLAAVIYLIAQRNWTASDISLASIGFGAYSVGLFGIVMDDYNSHFRYLVPGMMFALGAAWLQRTQTSPLANQGATTSQDA